MKYLGVSGQTRSQLPMILNLLLLRSGFHRGASCHLESRPDINSRKYTYLAEPKKVQYNCGAGKNIA